MNLVSSSRVRVTTSIAAMMLFVGFAAEVSAQGYVQSVFGDWTVNGKAVRLGTRLNKNVRLARTSSTSTDHLKLADNQGRIVATCYNTCQMPETSVPKSVLTSFVANVYKLLYGSPESSTNAAKGAACDNFDGIVEAVTADGRIIFDDDQIKELWGERGEIALIGNQQNSNGYIYGVNEIKIGDNTSRVLILSSDIYRNEEANYNELKRLIKYWQEDDVDSCSIKRFSEAYVDGVYKKNKKKILKYVQNK